jgi:hypothetical protein
MQRDEGKEDRAAGWARLWLERSVQGAALLEQRQWTSLCKRRGGPVRFLVTTVDPFPSVLPKETRENDQTVVFALALRSDLGGRRMATSARAYSQPRYSMRQLFIRNGVIMRPCVPRTVQRYVRWHALSSTWQPNV